MSLAAKIGDEMHTKNNKAFEIKNIFLQKSIDKKCWCAAKLIGLIFASLLNLTYPLSSAECMITPSIEEAKTELLKKEDLICNALLENVFKSRGNILVFPTVDKSFVVLGSFNGLTKVDDIAKNLTEKGFKVNMLHPLDCIMLAGKSLAIPSISDEKMNKMFSVLHTQSEVKKLSYEISYACLCASAYCGTLVKFLRLPGVAPKTDKVMVGYKFYAQIMAYIWLYLYEAINSKKENAKENAIDIARQLLMVGSGTGDEAKFLELGKQITSIIDSQSIDVVQIIKSLLPRHAADALLLIEASAFSSINNNVRLSLTWWLKAQHTEAQRLVLKELNTLGLIEGKLGAGTGVYSKLNPCVSCQSLAGISGLTPFKFLQRDRETADIKSTGRTWNIWPLPIKM